jgi:peptide/nickel transport system ATP-binding protein
MTTTPTAGPRPSGPDLGAALLTISDLSVAIRGSGRQVAALSHVDLTVSPGEVVGLVGESGGGKSMVARSVVGLLPRGAIATGRVDFAGTDVLTMDPRQLAEHRGGGAAMCFQNPRGALSPTRTVGRQLTDRLAAHQGLTGDRAVDAAAALLEQVGIRGARTRLGSYPHELSGGMAQRVMISLAVGCAPGLLIADEPTTGLDVTLTREILQQFRDAADTDHRGVLLISHDLASIAQVCDRVVVLYAGTVVEDGPAEQVLRRPAHPYAHALVRSVPELDGRPVEIIPGGMPLLTAPPIACPFADRCARVTDRCRTVRPRLEPAAPDGSRVACFHPLSADVAPAEVTNPQTPRSGTHVHRDDDVTGEPPVLEVSDAHVVYRSRFGSGGHHALRGVSLSVRPGETVGVVGESGCGKSTLAKLMVGLVQPSSGSVRLVGQPIAQDGRAGLRGRKLRRLRARAQMVFQDPIGSLSPRRSVADAIAEPLRASGISARERDERVGAALDRMKLDRSVLTRRPHELSGGQAQRIGIARALVADPDVIVLDEPTSALDVTVAAQILDVIGDVARDRTRGMVFISHDLAVVRAFADRVVVLYLGRIVEEGPVDDVFGRPRHPYTRALLSSVSSLSGTGTRDTVRLSRELQETDAAQGCPLAPRCPFAVDRCHTEEQQLLSFGRSRVACWRADDPEIATERQDITG